MSRGGKCHICRAQVLVVSGATNNNHFNRSTLATNPRLAEDWRCSTLHRGPHNNDNNSNVPSAGVSGGPQLIKFSRVGEHVVIQFEEATSRGMALGPTRRWKAPVHAGKAAPKPAAAVSVRCCWQTFPLCVLRNAEGLPATSFLHTL